ncbi:hypothetical protein GCM10007913_43790 [Devosia yakushimensis]|uniref:Bacteriocin-protection protein n=1 Tax=Devosia yakushimensis TaxID=470028 RepID=A0ABQ5UNX6_9HYPH|nr:YdeI/OmpD-associated family protein [Devosia yakushimensis]GLQ12446.1 hypothetical protein GCM10007913_43790 [Devosia yakushimensis]
MPPVIVDPERVREFADFDAFYDWLGANHASAEEVWIRIFKKASGRPTISSVEAIEVVLCWGWIDGIRKSWDDISFVQRYCPRRGRSTWSQINRDNVARMIEAGKMTAHGLAQVDKAKADGRWDAAYAMNMEPPAELLAAIEASPLAHEVYQTLTAQNRFALIFRTHNMKTPAGRAKRIADFVAMLERGETIYPQKGKR